MATHPGIGPILAKGYTHCILIILLLVKLRKLFSSDTLNSISNKRTNECSDIIYVIIRHVVHCFSISKNDTDI